MVFADVLIASSSLNKRTHEAVAVACDRRKLRPLLYLADEVLQGRPPLVVDVVDGSHSARLGGRDLLGVGAAWLWKVSQLHYYQSGDLAKKMSHDLELSRWHDALFTLLPEGVWLNSPRATSEAERKLQQLLLAARVGFATPRTMCTNDWDEVDAMAAQTGRSGTASGLPLAIKMFRGLVVENDEVLATYTRPFGEEEASRWRDVAVPLPGMIQPFLPKRREWRVTVVGLRVFAAIIDTDEAARNDWRRLQTTKAVRFARGACPTEIAEKCIEYLKALSLRYGAFDFVETPDGHFVFLECNPTGHFGWLEDELHMGIPDAIADELLLLTTQH